MKKLCTYLIIIILVTVSFLFSQKDFPAAGIQKWGDFYITLNNNLGIRVNGDAFAFVALAISPNRLFDSNQVRQSRPGIILTSHLVGSLIYASTYPFRDQLEHYFQSRISNKYPQKEKEKIARWFSFYSAYLLLNLVVLLITLYLFDSLVTHFTGPWKINALRYLFLFLLIDNPVTKLFFWSPHVRLLNIIIPLVMIWLSLNMHRFAQNKFQLYTVGFLAGVLLLFYGSFLLLFPVLIYGYWKHLQSSPTPWNFNKTVPFLILSIVYAIPLLTWMAIIKIQGGHFYSAELGEYRQFIWVADTFSESIGSFFKAFTDNSISFLSSLSSLLEPAIFLLAVYIFLKVNSASLALPIGSSQSLVFITITCILFFWLLGYYADRLSYSLATILYFIAALYANNTRLNRPFILLLWTMAISWHILLITSDPTYFGITYFN